MTKGSMHHQSFLFQQQLIQQRRQQQSQSLGQGTASEEMPGFSEYPVGPLDQRDVVWRKLQVLKERYLQDMEKLYQLMSTFDSRALNAGHVLKLKHYTEVVSRMLTYLRVPKDRLPLEFNQHLLESFARQIEMIIEVFKRKPDTVKSSVTNLSTTVSHQESSNN